MDNLGYQRKLCILPFDHRSYFEHLLGYEDPLTPEQAREISNYKRIIFEGYKKSLTKGVRQEDSAVLIDDVLGLEVLMEAKRSGYTVLQSTEVSGIDHFEFEHGSDWRAWLEKIGPNFAKVLLRYNIEGNQSDNNMSLSNLKLLSDYCRQKGLKFLIELLVPSTDKQLETVGGDRLLYDKKIRPGLTSRAIEDLHQHGVEPDVWKIEGMYEDSDYQSVVRAARADGRNRVGIIVLGRNESDEVVEHWLRVGSKQDGVIGFAVGRTIFLDSLLKYRALECSEDEASDQISERFLHFYNVFNKI